jgi:putative addiction module antidote
VLVLKVRKFGNSLGVVLPREVIHRLQTSEGESLFLIDGPEDSYRLTRYDPLFENRMARAEQIIARYRNALRKLSQ